jgi:MarR family transcriptional regulator for hemolysin
MTTYLISMQDLDVSKYFRFGQQLFAVAQAWRRAIAQVISSYGLTDAAAMSLVTLYRDGDGIRQNKLAESLGLESASVVRVLDGLEKNELVRREEDRSDRRAKLVWLTAEGLIVTAKLEDLLEELRQELMNDVDIQEIEATESLLNKIGKALSKRGEKPKE